MMVNYDTITGDYSPSYFDAEFTRCTHFRHMIERGSKIADFIHMLIAIIHMLIAMACPEQEQSSIFQ